MENFTAHLKKQWRTYLVAVWMICATGYLVYLNGVVQSIRQTGAKLSSDMDSVESILIGTDGNLSEMKKQSDQMAAKVDIILSRSRRR